MGYLRQLFDYVNHYFKKHCLAISSQSAQADCHRQYAVFH